MKTIFYLIIAVSIQGYVIGQEIIRPFAIEEVLENQRQDLVFDNRFVFGLNAGISLSFGNHHSSELRFNTSAGVSKGLQHKTWNQAPILLSYQLQIEVFRGGSGSSLLGTNRTKFQWEMRNIGLLNIGYVSNNTVKGRPLMKAVGASESPIKDPYDYSIGIGTLFINGLNHNRNQQAGIISLGVLEFNAAYLNDGPIFSGFGFGDAYDRWWTGAGYLGFYFLNNDGFVTDLSIQYQRYTGWQPNLYEMTNLLDIDYMSYLDKKEQFFNQGVWIWSVGLRNNTHLHLKWYEAKKTDVQKLIHWTSGYAFHPNPLQKRITYGLSYMTFAQQTLNQ